MPENAQAIEYGDILKMCRRALPKGRRPVALEEVSAMIGDGALRLIERAMEARRGTPRWCEHIGGSGLYEAFGVKKV